MENQEFYFLEENESPLQEKLNDDQTTFVYPKLYSKSLSGAIIVWEIRFNAREFYYYTIHGQIDGKLQQSANVFVKPKKTKTDLWDLAITSIDKKIKDAKIVKGYRTLEYIENEIPVRGKPMLAHQFKKKTSLKYPIYVQKKLDGHRLLVSYCRELDELVYLSRNNERHVFLQKHMGKELSRFLKFLDNDTELDGELWKQGLEFNEISSIVRPTVNEHSRLDELVYHIFDYDSSEKKLPYEDRHLKLENAYIDYINKYGIPEKFLVLESYRVDNHDELMAHHKAFVEEGYEGTIIRKIATLADGKRTEKSIRDSLYVHGRRNNLMKITDWLRHEGTVVGIENGKGKNSGLAKFIIQNPFYDVEKHPSESETFKLVPAGTHEDLARYFKNPDECIGQLYTFEYKNLSPYGQPLKARGVGFRYDL